MVMDKGNSKGKAVNFIHYQLSSFGFRKRKRDGESTEKEQPSEKKGKRTKVDGESDFETGSEADPKSEKARKGSEREKAKESSRRPHRDSDSHQKRGDLPLFYLQKDIVLS